MTAQATRARSPYWHGMLCDETRDEIAERLTELLTGRYFTLVCCNSYSEDSDRFIGVDVQPSERLTRPVRNYTDESLVGITWSTDRVSMGVHTKAATQGEARSGRPHNYVHFTFESDRVEIDHYAPVGYRLRWILAIERHDAPVDLPTDNDMKDE